MGMDSLFASVGEYAVQCALRWGICTNRSANMMYEMSGRPGWVCVSLLWYCLFMLIQPFE